MIQLQNPESASESRFRNQIRNPDSGIQPPWVPAVGVVHIAVLPVVDEMAGCRPVAAPAPEVCGDVKHLVGVSALHQVGRLLPAEDILAAAVDSVEESEDPAPGHREEGEHSHTGSWDGRGSHS